MRAHSQDPASKAATISLTLGWSSLVYVRRDNSWDGWEGISIGKRLWLLLGYFPCYGSRSRGFVYLLLVYGRASRKLHILELNLYFRKMLGSWLKWDIMSPSGNHSSSLLCLPCVRMRGIVIQIVIYGFLMIMNPFIAKKFVARGSLHSFPIFLMCHG